VHDDHAAAVSAKAAAVGESRRLLPADWRRMAIRTL
jgi:hypothetical protein